MPRSILWQFFLVLIIPVILILVSGAVFFYYSNSTASTSNQLFKEHIILLQQSKDLVQLATVVEQDSNRMITANSIGDLQSNYQTVLDNLDDMDLLVIEIGDLSNDLAVLSLYQANQLFRNTVHIAAQLYKRRLLQTFSQPEMALQQNLLLSSKNEIQKQIKHLTYATNLLAHQYTDHSIEELRQVSFTALQTNWVGLGLLIASVVLAFLGSWLFLGNRVITRLQLVSNRLRETNSITNSQFKAVGGNDEIGHMDRAVDQFLKDRQLLLKTQKELQKKIEELQNASDEINALRGIIPICASCKKIRDDKGYWNKLETYLEKHSEMAFSHGICPECSENLYGGQEWFEKMKQKKNDK